MRVKQVRGARGGLRRGSSIEKNTHHCPRASPAARFHRETSKRVTASHNNHVDWSRRILSSGGLWRDRTADMRRRNRVLCDIMAWLVASEATPPSQRAQPDERRQLASIGGKVPSGGWVGTQPIGGTCPPVSNGMGPESSQMLSLIHI